MSDMERLTIKETDYCDIVCGATCSDEIKSHCNDRNVYAKLRHYEDLEEQGRLIKLPCKEEGILYFVDEVCTDSYSILECKILSLIYVCGGINIKVLAFDGVDYFTLFLDVDWIGKTVFLIKSEAEAKLIELEGGAE